MGIFISKILGHLLSRDPVRCLMVGLDAAGKTTILYKMKLGEVVTTIPTVGFNVETVEYKNLKFTVWDVGGQYKIRRLWRYYYQGSHAIIFVVDSSDTSPERMAEARNELQQLIASDELRGASLLVLANKQDLPHSMPVSKLCDELGLRKLHDRKWNIQGCVATSGEGLYEGFAWLSGNIPKEVSIRM